jgi:DNA-binding NtrC family response regulator
VAAPTVINPHKQPAPDGRPRRWHLVVLGRDGAAPCLLPPAGGDLLIGRAEDADLRIVDPKASRIHARVHVTADAAVEIEDLASANGTRVRDEPLEPHVRRRLLPGDSMTIGNTILVLHGGDPELEARRVWAHGYLETRLIEECASAQSRGSQFALVRIHVTGRPLAALVEGCVGSVLRGGDLLAAYGPGEYQALLLDSGESGARSLAEAIDATLAAEGIVARSTVTCYPADGTSPQALLTRSSERAYAGGIGPPGGSAAASPAPALPNTPGSGLVRGSRAMQELHRLAQRAAASDTNVLILGETGAGKEVFAETVHRLSPRAAQPFLPLNCAAFSENLVESELFGFERGAFTGATHAKPGLLEAAAGGTLFLDEIGEMPLTVQAKLLRVIETRQVLRIGAVKPQAINVRFVAATHRDLEEEVAEKRFREDLYFRLNVITLQIPPLRERPDEIEPLALTFLDRLTRRLGRPTPRLSDEALGLLCSYAWPGNIRELRNVIERALVLCAGDVVTTEHLPAEKMRRHPWPPPESTSSPVRVTPSPSAPQPAGGGGLQPAGGGGLQPAGGGGLQPPLPGRDFKQIEREAIVDALARCHGNQTRAAELLGMPRRTFCKRVKDYELPRPRA